MNAFTKPKLTLGFLLILFILPLIAAGFMYFTGRGIPQHTVNHGALIKPPLDINQLKLANTIDKPFQGKWLLLYIAPSACSQHCQDTLYKLRQTQTALGKDSSRIRRVLIATHPLTHDMQQQLKTDYAKMQYYVVKQQALTAFLANSPFASEALAKGRLYIVDPLGNVMMTYPMDIAFKLLLSDLKRLLQLSQIG